MSKTSINDPNKTSGMSTIRAQLDRVHELVEDGDLDDLVHDVAATVGSHVNNSGKYEQVKWLWDHGVSYSEMLELLEKKHDV